MKDSYGFSKRGARRIVETVRRSEANLPAPQPPLKQLAAGGLRTKYLRVISNSGNGVYSVKEVVGHENAAADFDQTYSTVTDDVVGTAYEIRGNTAVPPNQIVVGFPLQVSSDTRRTAESYNQRWVFWYLGTWLEITGGTSPYYYKLLMPDASTPVTPAVTGSNLYDADGREGIPSGSIVRAWWDGENFQCSYHGADQGVPLNLESSGSTADASTWDRANQGNDRGVVVPWLTRANFNSTTYELKFFDRDNTKDANGHDTLIDAEGEIISVVLDSSAVSTNTYPYNNCDTDAEVARFDLDDLPTDEFCWVYNSGSGEMEPCYRDTVSPGAATNPVPCVLYQDTTPSSCGDLDTTVFRDNFDGTNGDSLNDCRWSRISSDGTAQIQSNKLKISIAENTTGSDDGEEKWENVYQFDGDFDIDITIDSTDLNKTTANGEFLRADIQLVDTGTLFRSITVGAWPPDSGFLPSQFGYDFQQDGAPSSNNGTTVTPGSHAVNLTRVGTALTGTIDGDSFSYNSTSGTVKVRIRVIATGSSNPACSATFDNFTFTE